ncbi:MAG: hypothetical protein OEM15_17765 [Myxococcales bacterium]|nr:hypothetical protein [Myxococcales bacterium]MDH3485592.1 hypothetical protein [Myxococcales bacterium]
MYLHLVNSDRRRKRNTAVRRNAKRKAKNRRRINRMHGRKLGRRL